jgi:outer membrane protein assembly factor BamB
MDSKRMPWIVGVLVLALAGASFAYWLGRDTPFSFQPRLAPEFDVATKDRSATGPEAGTTQGPGQAPQGYSGVWNMYRGPDLDNINKEEIPLADSWGSQGPEVLWKKDLGEGYAMPAVYKGKCYIVDYDEERKGDWIRCFSLETGQDIWSHFYPIEISHNHGVSRPTPAVNDKYVVALTANLFVSCFDAETGQRLWRMDLIEKYGSVNPKWYTSQSPVIEGEKVIIAPAGTTFMMAINCADGEILWETPEFEKPALWEMTYTSVTPIEFAGKKMYVYEASRGVAGIDAEDGKVLWKHEGWVVNTANAPSPIYLGQGKVFLTGGYGAGSRMLQIEQADDGSFSVRKLYDVRFDVFGCYQMTPILYEGKIFGVTDVGPRNGQLLCFDPAGEGSIVWSSGPSARFGWGPYVIADGKIYLMNNHGELRVARASTAGYEELGRTEFMMPVVNSQGEPIIKHTGEAYEAPPETWGPLTIVDGLLLCRDMHRLFCLDIRAK